MRPRASVSPQEVEVSVVQRPTPGTTVPVCALLYRLLQGFVMKQKDTACYLRETRTELRRDLDNVRRIWTGIGRTLATIQRACAAYNESTALLSDAATPPSVLPEILEPARGQFCVPRRVLDIAVPEVDLQGARVLPRWPVHTGSEPPLERVSPCDIFFPRM